jgi:hypothetical protein
MSEVLSQRNRQCSRTHAFTSKRRRLCALRIKLLAAAAVHALEVTYTDVVSIHHVLMVPRSM